MNAEVTAKEIAERFLDEQQHILRFATYLHRATEIKHYAIDDINHTLDAYGIPKWHGSTEAQATVSPDEVAEFLLWAKQTIPLVKSAIDQQRKEVEEAGRRFSETRVPREVVDDELMEYATQVLGGQSDGRAIEKASQLLMHHVVKYCPTDSYTVPLDVAVSIAIDQALNLQVLTQDTNLKSVGDALEKYQYLGRVQHSETELHALRQGFILLMTAFDAAVFDMVRIAMRRKFFDLVASFGKTEKVSFEDMGKAGSFEAVRDRVVEDQLKKRYLKDLLGLLRDNGVTCVDQAAGDKHVHLVELVQRRNLHVHNRGKVDERYLDIDPDSGKAKYNIFNLKLGDVARIDSAYWRSANRICTNCVNLISAWADA